jgi:hypothetical protein
MSESNTRTKRKRKEVLREQNRKRQKKCRSRKRTREARFSTSKQFNSEFNYDSVEPKNGTLHAELIQYIKQLDEQSHNVRPNTWIPDRIGQCVHNPDHKKVQLLKDLQAEVTEGINVLPDITLVTSCEDLNGLLRHGFERPLLIPADSELAKDLCTRLRTKTFKEILDSIFTNDANKIDIQDTGKPLGKPMNRTVNVRDVKRRFLLDGGQPPWNGLEVGDPDDEFKGPPVLRSSNLLHHFKFKMSDSAGRRHYGKGSSKQLESWFLVTEANAVSKAHIDTSGLGTMVMVLKGSKIWYFLLEEDWAQWKEHGPDLTWGYKRGWAKVELVAGDIL